MPYVTRRQFRRIKREARREGFENGYAAGYTAGFGGGRKTGCIIGHNSALGVVKNALAGWPAPPADRRMRSRLHNTLVDGVATIREQAERAAVQRAVNIIAKRVARGKSVRVRLNGETIRPKKGKRVR